MYTDKTILSKGKYKMRRLEEVPAEYLLTLWEHQKGGRDPGLREYITQNLESIKQRAGLVAPPIQLVTFICDKITFPTKRDAQDSLKRIRQEKSKRGKPIRAYECPDCSGWHLTSMPVEIYKSIKINHYEKEIKKNSEEHQD